MKTYAITEAPSVRRPRAEAGPALTNTGAAAFQPRNYQRMANDSPQTMQLKRQADVAAVGSGAMSLQRYQRMASDGAEDKVVQRVAAGGADYTLSEKRNAITHATDNPPKAKPKPKDSAQVMATYLIGSCGGLATDYRNKGALEKACVLWWNRPSLVDEPVVVAARAALVAPTITYDSEHGDLHFIANPTDTKSAWTLDKTAATAAMEAEIRRHLSALGVNSAKNENGGWSAFYITAQHGSVVGAYTGEKKKNQWPTTDHYTMQVQVNYAENKISYHGFPDERIEGHTLGCSINKTDATKLT